MLKSKFVESMIGLQSPTARITSLDALRGIAALMVLANHLAHSFIPHLFSSKVMHGWGSIGIIPVGFFLNGGAAVVLFFILSGFVLTQRFFETGKITNIPDSMIKRWPRLVGPVAIVSLVSGFLMGFGLYDNSKVYALNGSSWLAESFYWPPRGLWDVSEALKQAMTCTSFQEICDYNGAFWTLHFEFLGSMAVYLLALFILILQKRVDLRIILLLLTLLWIREIYRFPFMACFVLGAILALIYTRYPMLLWCNRLSLFTSLAICIAIGGLTLSEHDLPGKFYALFSADTASGHLGIHCFLYSVIGALFISAALWTPLIRSFLSRPMLRKLGHLSFPIYLVHTPIICSVGTWTYLSMYPHGITVASFSAIIVTIIGTLIFSIPLALFDDKWLILVRRITPFRILSRFWKTRSQVADKSLS